MAEVLEIECCMEWYKSNEGVVPCDFCGDLILTEANLMALFINNIYAEDLGYKVCNSCFDIVNECHDRTGT